MLAKLRKNYPLIISTFLIIYFLVNLFGGERGKCKAAVEED